VRQLPIIADEIIKILDKLESGRDLNDKLIRILKNEVVNDPAHKGQGLGGQAYVD